MSRRIMIIGSGGAGKSTLARELGQKYGLKVYHLDALLWKPNWNQVPRDQQITIQKEIIEEQEWIIDGNYGGTMDMRIEAADTIEIKKGLKKGDDVVTKGQTYISDGEEVNVVDADGKDKADTKAKKADKKEVKGE